MFVKSRDLVILHCEQYTLCLDVILQIMDLIIPIFDFIKFKTHNHNFQNFLDSKVCYLYRFNDKVGHQIIWLYAAVR